MPRRANLLSHLDRLAAPAATDAVLLARWVERGDEAAFSALMARHGPMVLGVCRRLTGDADRAEDVFQAVFLVLTRQASRLRRPEALAGFLHTIAVRLARKARAVAHRRQRVQAPLDAAEPLDPRPHPLDLLSGRELLALLDEEIARLPEVNRLPLLLCLMQGRTIEEAARLLGWSIGSLRGRLTRGRERLRQRLRRRGLDLSAGVVALLTPAVLPEHLRAACVRNLTVPAAPAVHTLMAGWTTTLKLKGIGLALFLTVALGLGAGLTLLRAPETETPATPSPATSPAQVKDEPRRDRYGDPLPSGAVARLGTLRYRAPDKIDALAFAPDGKTLAVSSHAGLFLIDAANGKRLRQLTPAENAWGEEDPKENPIVYSPDGKRLISRGSKSDGQYYKGVVRVFELADDRKPREHDAEHVIWVGWSVEGKPLAVILEKEGLCLRELASGRVRRFACKDLRKLELFEYVFCVCAPAGKALAVVDEQGRIHVWDVESGRERCIIQPKNAYVFAFALSADGRTLASLARTAPAQTEFVVQLWDAATGKVLRTVAENQEPLSYLAFTPDGKSLAAIGWDDVRIWEVTTGRQRSHCRVDGTIAAMLAFSRDGTTLATAEGGGGAVHLWDVATGKLKPQPVGHRSRAMAVFAPDGQRVAASGLYDGIYIWDPKTSKPLAHVPRRRWMRDYIVSPDGRSLYSLGDDEEVWICDAASGERQYVLKIEDPERPDNGQLVVNSLYRSRDGKTLVALSHYYDRKNEGGPRYQQMLVTGWDTSTRRQLFRRRRPGTDSWVALSADARVLAVPYPQSKHRAIGDGPMRLEDVATGEPLLTVPTLEGQAWPLAFSPDGRLLASNNCDYKRQGKKGDPASATGNALHLWETATAADVLTLPLENPHLAVFSPDGRLLALPAPSQEILVYDLAHGRAHRRFKGFGAQVNSLVFSPDGRRLVSGLSDSTLLVWDVGAPEPLPVRALGAEGLAKRWTDLASEDAPRAFRSRGMLASSPEETIPFLKEHLHPTRPADPKRLRQLLADLESEQFAVREKAQAALAELGDLAALALRQTLADKPTLEVRRRVQALLDRLREPVKRPEMLRSLRAIAVLEDIGTPAARRLLEELAKGADGARVTREAKESMQRLTWREASVRGQ